MDSDCLGDVYDEYAILGHHHKSRYKKSRSVLKLKVLANLPGRVEIVLSETSRGLGSVARVKSPSHDYYL